MENHAVRRRTNVIAAHLASHDEISASAAHIFPMSCSNSLNPMIRRCDNRMSFARQGSNSQGFFMRQSSNEQANFVQPAKAPIKFTRCGAVVRDDPMFAKPRTVEQGLPRVKEIQSSGKSCGGFAYHSSPDGPRFARPNQSLKESSQVPRPSGFELAPRMNVEESRFNFVIRLAIPGVSRDKIRVEIHDDNLIVTGKRSTWPRSQLSYHKEEISQEPFRIVWPIPTNANKETVSAEIQDGILMVTVPKLSGIRWLRKAHL